MGTAHKFGDDINTDYIISSQRKRDTVDPNKLARYLMEDIRPGFGLEVQEGDFIVAGHNFGCGSAMEIAPLVIKAAGVQAVIARSFARAFYRNAVNIGLNQIEADTADINQGDDLELVSPDRVRNLGSGRIIQGKAQAPLIRTILDAGGIIAYMEREFG